MKYKIHKTDEEWKKQLTSQQFDVARKRGTEPAFTGEYWNTHDKGIYYCACCGIPLFASETKFDSGTGWPSFSAPVDQNNIEEQSDRSMGMLRVEVKCGNCDAHLGHVFEDGPQPTGLRYCMNSVSLKFIKE